MLSYRQHVQSYIAPQIGAIPLQALDAAAVNGLYGWLATAGRVHGEGGLGAATCRRVHATLHRSLRDAVRWGMVNRNATDAADPPKASAAKAREMATWSAAEVGSFLRHVHDDRLVAAWTLLVTSGARRGEVLGARWQDLDLNTGRLAVRQTLIQYGRTVELSNPKTSRGRRVIDLDDHTVAVLRTWRARQLRERMAWPGWADTGLIFSRENGVAVHPGSFTQLFNKHLGRAGLPRIRLHDVRHTWATLALEAGVPAKVVSDRLGHASVGFTMDVHTRCRRCRRRLRGRWRPSSSGRENHSVVRKRRESRTPGRRRRRSDMPLTCVPTVGTGRIELPTRGLKVRRSTTDLRPRRTRA